MTTFQAVYKHIFIAHSCCCKAELVYWMSCPFSPLPFPLFLPGMWSYAQSFNLYFIIYHSSPPSVHKKPTQHCKVIILLLNIYIHIYMYICIHTYIYTYKLYWEKIFNFPSSTTQWLNISLLKVDHIFTHSYWNFQLSTFL